MTFQDYRQAFDNGRFYEFVVETAKTGELFDVFPCMRDLDKVAQDARWHPEGDVFVHTLLVVKNLPANATFAQALCALLHDVGKKDTTVVEEGGKISAHNHEDFSAVAAEELLTAYGADEQLKREVVFLVRRHMTAHSRQATKRTLRRLVREGGIELTDRLLRFGEADVAAASKDFELCQKVRAMFEEVRQEDFTPKVKPLVNGEDVMALLGLKPGKAVGDVLKAVADAGFTEREEALEFVRNYAV